MMTRVREREREKARHRYNSGVKSNIALNFKITMINPIEKMYNMQNKWKISAKRLKLGQS